jgi:hypothetical protein
MEFSGCDLIVWIVQTVIVDLAGLSVRGDFLESMPHQPLFQKRVP